MAWRLAKSLEVLRSQVDEAYPDRNKASDGTIGDAAHAASASDHNPNAAGVVCALDITHSPPTLDAHSLADRLLAVRHPDTKYIISNYRIAGAWTNWKWAAYNGADPHFNHIHISVGAGPDGQSAQPYDDTNLWNVKGDTMPSEQDVRNAFKQYNVIGSGKQAGVPGDDQVKFYAANPWTKLLDDLLTYVATRERAELAAQAVELQPGIYKVK